MAENGDNGMSAFREILEGFRAGAKSEREKGDAFERLIQSYLKNDPKYDFSDVWLWGEWAKSEGRDARDTGIDIVAKERVSGNIWAVQCKFYDEEAKIYKKHVDSFFTESGKAPFAHRLIVITTPEISEHVQRAVEGQHIPCSTLTLTELEESAINWEKYKPGVKAVLREKKNPRDHQKKAVAATVEKLKSADRGKLLMACGTGKTYTALKIAEKMVGKGKTALFLVPSLSLLSQSLSEWTLDSETPLTSFAVCSDVTTGKKKNEDVADITPSDLAYPATTKANKLAEKMSQLDPERMTVVFSTYHSLQVISEAQKNFGLHEFELIICDEAHRTTGATLLGEDESNFVRVHDQEFIKGKKRIYMTATPRVFGDAVKSKADEVDAVLCSMDDPKLYGETLYTINFSDAVRLGLLSDYKVLVLAVDEAHVSKAVQKLITDSSNELILDDATKIVGCWKALSKFGLKEEIVDDHTEMRRGVAFCRDIRSSQLIAEYFPRVVEEYLNAEGESQENPLQVEVRHVQGSYNSIQKESLLGWLKAGFKEEENKCKILSNARCLSEGVDVPSLDAVLFMNPRKSQVDIVQAVGRVMRKVPGKERGYVILPIGVPAGVTPEQALSDNDKYKVVWQVLQALRSHDDKFEALINGVELGRDISSKMEIIAITHDIKGVAKDAKDDGDIGIGQGAPAKKPETSVPKPTQMPLAFEGLEKAILAKIVKKCGKRFYWEEWAGDIAKIAKTHITRIEAALSKPDSKERKAFDEFLEEMRDDLNESISEQEAIEMLAQHLITKPVFDALFEGYNFASNNPVSQAMQGILEVLNEHNLEKESATLKDFYESVKFRASGIDSSEGKQRIILELYDKFFKKAFPKMTEKLGIVYTPVEVVDFIIHSVNDVLKQEFGETVGSKGVHILDPFTGTGTFITRLLQSGLIDEKELKYKYDNEIHANEIVLLAYYIAAINIEAVYHTLSGGDYKPFGGICLTDTFQLYEKDDMISRLMVDNSSRRAKQKKLDIRVIMGNPPYSAGQGSANDNNANIAYPSLDESIAESYAKYSSATLKNSLYDSYIRAIRWGSDRIGKSGVMAYVSNAGWIDGNAMDGLRKCLREEFSSIYVFHLRGNQRTSGELSRREGGKIFGGGSRTPISISLFVKNPKAIETGKIYFHDIGDYLSREEKLNIVSAFKSIEGITARNAWKEIVPDQHNDWLGQRDDSFQEFISLGDKKDKVSPTLFADYSGGLKTNRDAWCYNCSRLSVETNIKKMTSTYNSEVARFKSLSESGKPKNIDDFIITDPTKISWSDNLKTMLEKGHQLQVREGLTIGSVYRPFSKQWLFYSRQLNERMGKMPRIFPDEMAKNRVFSVSGIGAKTFGVLMVGHLPCFDMIEKGQCFPLKLYEKEESSSPQEALFKSKKSSSGYTVKDGISDEGLEHFRKAYPNEKISKEDIFYYIYGLLHSEEYREKYADNLSKQLPRIPCVKDKREFWAFTKAGRALADLHVDYEKVEPYPVTFKGLDPWKEKYSEKDVRVEKMKFGKDKDKTTVIYNSRVTITDIPLEAYEYVVNGKPAIEWVMERQVVKTDKDSGIVNDANLYATETVGDAAYPLKLLQRVIMVSLETMKIVKSLPKLNI